MVMQNLGGQTMCIMRDVRMANVSKLSWSKTKILFNIEKKKKIINFFNCFMEVVTLLCYVVPFKTA